jgi:BASS family bile acid:Na+ symporter
MLADYLNHASPRGRRIVFAIAAVSVVAIAAAFVGWNHFASYLSTDAILIAGVVGYLLGALVAGVVYHDLKRRVPLVVRLMPWVAMFGIVYVTSVTAAAGRDRLLAIGWLLFLAVVVHNTTGYVLGYWFSRLFGLDEKSARTVALEVGLQNGGMASTIAAAKGQLATLGLAAAVFNPWMNTSGSLLANYWRRRPVEADSAPTTDEPGPGEHQAD